MRFVASAIAAISDSPSGVLRSARTFHPDGPDIPGHRHREGDRTLRCFVPASCSKVASSCRIGMGLVKRSTAGWIRDGIPDAPSVAARFSPSSDADVIGRGRARRGRGEVDILLTAGGDRLWKR